MKELTIAVALPACACELQVGSFLSLWKHTHGLPEASIYWPRTWPQVFPGLALPHGLDHHTQLSSCFSGNGHFIDFWFIFNDLYAKEYSFQNERFFSLRCCFWHLRPGYSMRCCVGSHQLSNLPAMKEIQSSVYLQNQTHFFKCIFLSYM